LTKQSDAAAAVSKIEEELGGAAPEGKDNGKGQDVATPVADVHDVKGIAGSMKFEMRELSTLSPAKDFRKADKDDVTFAELVKSVKRNGVLVPITIVGGKVIAGRRRLAAAKSAGLKVIPTVEIEADDNARLLITLLDNVQRKNLNGVEEAKAYKALIDGKVVKNQAELSRILGISEVRMSQKLSVLGLSPKLRKAVTENRISSSAAIQLKTAETSVVDAVLGEAEKTKKKVSTKKAKAAAKGKTAITVPLTPDVPEEVTAAKVNVDGVTLTVKIAHTNKTYKNGTVGQIMQTVTRGLKNSSIDAALSNARKEIG
jgi:ParB/RepB/Spo0J family partition protein